MWFCPEVLPLDFILLLFDFLKKMLLSSLFQGFIRKIFLKKAADYKQKNLKCFKSGGHTLPRIINFNFQVDYFSLALFMKTTHKTNQV